MAAMSNTTHKHHQADNQQKTIFKRQSHNRYIRFQK